MSLCYAPLLVAFVLVGCAQAPPAPNGVASTVQAADPERLAAVLRSRPIVLLGEVHDNATQHALRAQALRALLRSGARPALLMEQFDRERQAELDRALAQPGASADSVIAGATGGGTSGASGAGWTWSLYRPYIALAIEYRLTIVAANVSRADTRAIVRDGLAAHGFDANVPVDIEEIQARTIADSHCGLLDAADARRLVAAQVARDQFMARTIEALAPRGVVLLAGNGHVRSDAGVPRWLSAGSRARSVAIGLLEQDEPAAVYDVVMTTPGQARPDPCEALRASPAR
ncbi:MAG TPA: ChaN family lipoprotein [Burkholderiaceae bacterium]|nr:ChaN family lipoprotein [Burkholderiaceae bacterium]